jgi:hypothetical protein
MAGIDLTKELVFHNPGKGLLETVTGKLCEITYGQSMKFDVKATLVDVEGGDGLFPIYTFISKKEGTIEIESAVFTLNQSAIGQSIEYTNTNVLKNSRVILTNAATTLGTGLTGITNVRCIGPDGNKIAVTQSGTADANGVDVSATGTVTWGTGVVAGEYTFWFQSISDTATQAGLLKNAMPEVCSFTWMLPSEDLDGSTYQVDVYAKRVRADGSFTIDAKKNSASVPKLSLKILDPGDGSENFAEIVISKVA